MRRLTADEHLTSELATTWRTYELDKETRSLLEYAEKLTKAPGMIDDGDIDALRAAGWSEDAIYEATALISFSISADGWRPRPSSGGRGSRERAATRSALCDWSAAMADDYALQRPAPGAPP